VGAHGRVKGFTEKAAAVPSRRPSRGAAPRTVGNLPARPRRNPIHARLADGRKRVPVRDALTGGLLRAAFVTVPVTGWAGSRAAF
jgi:hypothetical protein